MGEKKCIYIYKTKYNLQFFSNFGVFLKQNSNWENCIKKIGIHIKSKAGLAKTLKPPKKPLTPYIRFSKSVNILLLVPWNYIILKISIRRAVDNDDVLKIVKLMVKVTQLMIICSQ